MKKWTAVVAPLLLASAYGFGQTEQTAPAAPVGRKACEELKAEIAKKLDAKGVTSYSLDIVEKGKEGDGKVVGSCDGGTKSVLYSRTSASEAKSAATKPAQ